MKGGNHKSKSKEWDSHKKKEMKICTLTKEKTRTRNHEAGMNAQACVQMIRQSRGMSSAVWYQYMYITNSASFRYCKTRMQGNSFKRNTAVTKAGIQTKANANPRKHGSSVKTSHQTNHTKFGQETTHERATQGNDHSSKAGCHESKDGVHKSNKAGNILENKKAAMKRSMNATIPPIQCSGENKGCAPLMCWSCFGKIQTKNKL